MNLRNAQFIKGITGTSDIINDTKYRIAFVGRSNVGKSSLINSLTDNKNLARSSSTPGRTRQINFFLIDQKLYFVDLPGYGYAKASEKQRGKIRGMIVWYLTYGEVKLKKAVLIVDAKVGLNKFDLEMIDLFRNEKINFLVVLNKADKLKQGKLFKLKKEVEIMLKEDGVKVIPYSSKNPKNKNELSREILC